MRCRSFCSGSCGSARHDLIAMRGEVMPRGGDMDLLRGCIPVSVIRAPGSASAIASDGCPVPPARSRTSTEPGWQSGSDSAASGHLEACLPLGRSTTGPAGSDHGCSSIAEDAARHAKSAISCGVLAKGAGRAHGVRAMEPITAYLCWRRSCQCRRTKRHKRAQIVRRTPRHASQARMTATNWKETRPHRFQQCRWPSDGP